MQQDTSTEQGSRLLPGRGSIHGARMQLTTGTSQSPRWGPSWDTAQALLGAAGPDVCVEATVWTQQKPSAGILLTAEGAMIFCPHPSLPA